VSEHGAAALTAADRVRVSRMTRGGVSEHGAAALAAADRVRVSRMTQEVA
jgi:hypothetical protein